MAEIAETASGTLDLQGVFSRVAASVGRVISFDNMGVVRIVDGRFAVSHATTVECSKSGTKSGGPIPLTSWSPRIRPRPGPNPRIEDARAELDPAFPKDADILEGGTRSVMWEPFPSGEAFSGGVWLSAFRTRAFTDEDQRTLRPIAALLGSAVQHWTIWDADGTAASGSSRSRSFSGLSRSRSTCARCSSESPTRSSRCCPIAC